MKEKLKAKLRTKSFWVALAGVAAMIFGLFGVEGLSEPVGRIVEAIGGILVLTGIVASPAKSDEAEKSEVGEIETNGEECAREEIPSGEKTDGEN